VLYEVGIAHTLAKPTILLSREVEQIPFDLRVHRAIFYSLDTEGIEKAREHLESAIRQTLGIGRLVEAEALLKQGKARTAVALASVYLENAMRQLVNLNEARISSLLKGRKPYRLAISQMLEYLSKLGVISKKDAPRIRRCISLRNKAVHGLKEPKITEAKSFIEIVNDFVKKYLGKDFNS